MSTSPHVNDPYEDDPFGDSGSEYMPSNPSGSENKSERDEATINTTVRTRKRTRNEQMWPRNIMKAKRIKGEEYRNFKVEVVNKLRCYKKNANPSRRSNTRLYYLTNENGEKVKICKEFCKKINGENMSPVIKQARTKYWISKILTDSSRISHIIEKLKNHHRKYLSPDLSLGRMYSLYKDQTPEPVSYFVFANVFNKQLNLHFHAPVSDSCRKSDFLNVKIEASIDEAAKQQSITEQELHLRKAESAREGMKADARVFLILSYLITSKRSTDQCLDKKLAEDYHKVDTRICLVIKASGSSRNKKKIYKDIYIPEYWCNVIRSARKKDPFKLIFMTSQDFFSTASLQAQITNRKKSINDEKVEWLKMQWLKFKKDELFLIHFKYYNNYLVPFTTVKIAKMNAATSSVNINLQLLYLNGHKVDIKKKKDLLTLSDFIPSI
ncbi:unnamed protein product [Psylliodes chrysocephalus]|uniref:Uncharacterized protein n=1 Tax=Psylliodes chrysocephalus TaxID=3402493 RepID=A0A9P0DBX1_9CUCU|nr:unnamed protein product [Psylliodes chrysocephala]